MTNTTVTIRDNLEAVDAYFQEHGWSDGLPIVPPTPERLNRFLAATKRNPDEVVANLPPIWGEASIKLIAVNAIMAGCRPEYLPVVIAAVEAVADPQFNLYSVQTTTNPVGPSIIVNGPVVKRLGVASGGNCFGPGFHANATIGRALRLVLLNIGGADPGTSDRATQGQPGKYAFCFAENDERNPWEPLSQERGFPPNASTVTVAATAAFVNIMDCADNADELLNSIAAAIALPCSNDYMFGGEPAVILSPEHVAILHKEGLTKQKVKEELFRRSAMPASRFSKRNIELLARWRIEQYPTMAKDTLITAAKSPGGFLIAIAGGDGVHSCHLMSFGDARAVTKVVHE